MTLFLLVFILLYGSLHYYFYTRIRKAFRLSSLQRYILMGLLLILMFTPIVERFLIRMGVETSAWFLAFTAYIWMAVIFQFFNIAVLIHLYTLLLRFIGFILHKDTSRLIPSARFFFLVPLLLALSITGYGYIEAQDIRTETVTIKSRKIPVAAKVRIVQISDVHLGLIIREGRLKEMLKPVIAAKPDLLVSTGDLLDGQSNGLAASRSLLRDIRTRYGKFAVTGNHEFYAGLGHFNQFVEGTGFRVLRGEGVTVGGILNIIGVDDPAGERMGLSRMVSEKELLSQLPSRHFTLLLKHRPVVDQEAVGQFDLQLSGHTHNGQIFPFSMMTRLFFPYNKGLFHLNGGSLLYVSRGTGTWGPPIRFLSPPQITIIDLVPEERI